MSTRLRGFTLLEVLVSIALLSVIGGIGIPPYLALMERADLDATATTVVSNLRLARARAAASDGDTAWGLYLTGGAMTIFKGTSYAGRDIAYDESDTISQTITPSGLTEIVFTKFTGAPVTTGTLTLTSPNETRTITLNTEGVASY